MTCVLLLRDVKIKRIPNPHQRFCNLASSKMKLMTTAVKEINRYIDMLSEDEQDQLARVLRKKY